MRYGLTIAGLCLTLAASAAFAAGCAPAEVDEPSTERYEACEAALECVQDCPSPSELLADYGCFAEDTESTAPNCDLMTNHCKEAKEACFADCDVMCEVDMMGDPTTCTDDEYIACLLPCRDELEPMCVLEYEAWLAGRDQVINDFRTCLRPCEGGNSRALCEAGEVYCDAIDDARHLAVSAFDQCQSGGDPDACAFECSDPGNGYSIPEP